MLNLANLNAENIGITNATALYCSNNEYIINPGKTPKETISHKESNCLPSSEEDLNNLATKPSKKSNIAAK